MYLTVNLNLIIFLRRIASPNSLHPESKFSLTEQEAIDAEINDFLVKQVIEQSQPETGEIVSPIFIRPKKELKIKRALPVR